MGTNTIFTPEIQGSLRSIRRLVRTLRSSAKAVEQQAGMSTAQLFVLQLLAEGPAESMNDLADRTMTDQSSVSAVVARLEERQLVTRTPSAIDGRRTTVALTELGRAQLDNAPTTVQARLLFALERMRPDDLREITIHLNELIALMGGAHEPPAFLFEEEDATGSR